MKARRCLITSYSIRLGSDATPAMQSVYNGDSVTTGVKREKAGLGKLTHKARYGHFTVVVGGLHWIPRWLGLATAHHTES